MAELSIGGEAFHVEIEGAEEAPVLMLSNALGTTLHMWDPQLPALLKHYRVLRYDARGHGESAVSEGPYSLAELGRDALAILDTLGLEKVDFLGLSLGGIVGQWLLTHAPKRIGKAVLANTAAQLAPADLWNSRIQTVLNEGLGAVAPSVIEHWFTKDFREAHPEQVAEIEDMILKANPNGYAATCAALRDADLREAIRSVEAPVLVMVGRHDTTTPPGIGALITSSIPKAKLVTLEASHLSNIEDAEQFTEKALEFLLSDEPIAAPAPKAPSKPRAKKHAAETPALDDIEAPGVAVKKKASKTPARKPAAPVAASPASVAGPSLDDVEAPITDVPRKAPVKAAATRKAAAKKTPKVTVAPAPKAPPKKAAAKKTAVKKAAPKKAAVKKAVPKKAAVKKAAPKKAAVKKAVPKKTAVKKTAAKKMAVKKSAIKKLPAKKAATKKAVAKKAMTKKAASKKTAVKKSVRKALPSRKTAAPKAMRKPVKKMVAKKAPKRR